MLTPAFFHVFVLGGVIHVKAGRMRCYRDRSEMGSSQGEQHNTRQARATRRLRALQFQLRWNTLVFQKSSKRAE